MGIAKVARQAGLAAQIEQKMPIPGQTQEDGEPAPGSVRPLHRADVHIIEPMGSEIWIDVRAHTHTAHVDPWSLTGHASWYRVLCCRVQHACQTHPGCSCRASHPEECGRVFVLSLGRGSPFYAVAPAKHWVQNSGFPLAWQGVKPISMSMVRCRPGRVVPREVAEPGMSETSGRRNQKTINNRRVASE